MDQHEDSPAPPRASADRPERRPPGREALGFRLIGAMKLSSGLLLVLAGFGLFRLIRGDFGANLNHLVSRLHLDPESWLVHEAVSRLAGVSETRLRAIGAGTFFYAALHVVEGTGLLLLRRWAEWLTVIATGSLLPLELYEVARKVNAVRLTVLAVNVAVVVYLVVKLRQQHRESRPA